MATAERLRHSLRIASIALALTATAIGVISPLREFYMEITRSAQRAQHVAALTGAAQKLIWQRRLQDAEALLLEAQAIDADDPALEQQRFIIGTWERLEEAEDFDSRYAPAKHETLVPLITLGLRLVEAAEDSVTRSRLLAHLGLLQWFDPARTSGTRIEALSREALALDDGNVLAWTLLGVVLREEERYAEALAALREAVAREDVPGFTWEQLALEHERRQAPAKALAAWLKVYHSERPALSLADDQQLRRRAVAQDAIKAIIDRDLLRVESGLPGFGLSAEKRLELLETSGLDRGYDRLTYARALAFAGRDAVAVEVALKSVDLEKDPRWWGDSDIASLAFLANLPRSDSRSEEQAAIDAAWQALRTHWHLQTVTAAGGRDGAAYLIRPEDLKLFRLTTDSRLYRAGARPGDRIRAVGGIPVSGIDTLTARLDSIKAYDNAVPLLVERNFTPRTLALAPRPES